jgi:hypothetical protein
MINDILYIILGAGLMFAGSKSSENQPSWMLNIWGLVLVLRGIGFFHAGIPSWSFLPFGMISAMVFFKGSRGLLKPMFFLCAVLILTMPVISYGNVAMGSVSSLLMLVVFGGGFVVLMQPKENKQSYTTSYIAQSNA